MHSVGSSVSNGSSESVDRAIRVLYVDDDESFLTTTKQILELKNLFHVETVSVVKEALLKLQQNDFDAVVSDYQMSEKDGLTFLSDLRESGNNLPFILFTGKGREEVAIKALNLGADYYINKTGHPETVYSQLSHYIVQAVNKRKTEEKLKQSEKKYRLLTENLTDVVFIQNLDMSIKYVSPSVEALSGYTPEEAIKLTPKEFIAPTSYEKAVKTWNAALSLASTQSDDNIRLMQYEYVRKDGSTFWGELRVKFLRDSNGNLLGTQGTLRDVTERKETEEKLKKSEEMYRLLTENITDAVFIQDMNLRVTFVSPSIMALSGYTPDEVLALKTEDFMTPESFAKGVNDFKNAIALAMEGRDDEIPLTQYEYIRKDGSTFWGELRTKLLRDSTGNLSGLQGTLRDITERKNAEDALRQEREMLELVTSNINAGLTIISRDYKVLWANKFLRNIYGDVIGKTCYSLYNDRTCICPNCGVKEIFETGKNHVIHEQLIPVSGGQRAWMELTSNPIRDEKGDVIAVSELCVFLNERKEMENKLREAEKRYRMLFDKAPLGILIVDSNGVAVEFNEEAHRQLGYSREEFSKLAAFEYDAQRSPDEIKAHIDKIISVGKDEFETKHRTKSGEVREFVNVIQVIELDGQKFLHVIKRDITDRKKTEQRLSTMMEELRRLNEKLSVVGKLTRHDARNKLSVIANQVYLVKLQLEKDKNSLEYLESIESAIDQIEKIFSFARTYELLGSKDLSYMDVKTCVDEASMIFSSMNKVKLVNNCSGLSVLSDSLLRQLFYNLIDNTLKYGKTVTQIKTFYVEKQDHLNLIYEDNGVGLPDGEKEKIFMERYGNGTGYGLYLIQKMCEVYGWTIKETGEYGKGAQFTITVPKSEKGGNPSYVLKS